MKKILISIMLFGFTLGLNAQITELTNGNVGIGTINPGAKLEVVGQTIINGGVGAASSGTLLVRQKGDTSSDGIAITSSNTISHRLWKGNNGNLNIGPSGHLSTIVSTISGNVGINTTNPQEKFQIGNSYTFHDGGHKVIGFLHVPSVNIDLDATKYSAEIRFDPTLGNLRLGTSSSLTGNPNTHFSINKNGNIGIGTTSPDSKLTVAGKIHSQEVKVTVNAGADFVFENNYELPTLNEVETYIHKNKHLPEIASAEEMERDGIYLAEMNIKLLQKIEELTLYTIQQQKDIESLKSLKTKFEILQAEIERLKKK